MTNLDKFNQKTMSSREIAQLTIKDHRNVLRDCDILNESYERMSLLKIEQSTYNADNGQSYREYLLTRMQTFDLMTGYSVELRIKVNRRWEELEAKEQQAFQLPQTYSEALRELADKAEANAKLQQTIEMQQPKVLYADSVQGSKTNITIEHMAKILCQNGIKIGQNRFFNWLVEKNYLIRHKRWSNKNQRYINDYTPTQRAAEMNIFYVANTPILPANADPFVRHTVKVTGKGQIYFVNKFKTPGYESN